MGKLISVRRDLRMFSLCTKLYLYRIFYILYITLTCQWDVNAVDNSLVELPPFLNTQIEISLLNMRLFRTNGRNRRLFRTNGLYWNDNKCVCLCVCGFNDRMTNSGCNSERITAIYAVIQKKGAGDLPTWCSVHQIRKRGANSSYKCSIHSGQMVIVVAE